MCLTKERSSGIPVDIRNIQVYLRDVAGLVPEHCNKASFAIKPVVITAFRGSCLEFGKTGNL